MKKFRSSYLLWIIGGVLLVGLFTVDLESKRASVITMPDFEATTNIKDASQQPSPTLQDFNDGIVNIAEQTSPTAVTVTISQTVEVRSCPFAGFFGLLGEPRKFQRHGLGSGFIVSEEGYILTNPLVVEGAEDVDVKLYNDKSYKAK